MITTVCILCGCDFECTIDDLLEDDENLCPECSAEAFIWCTENSIKPN